MSPEAADQVVASLAQDLAHMLAKAAALANVAAGEPSASRQQTIETFLDLEPPVFDAQRIISAACLLQRRAETGRSSLDPP
jgi:hypothetical protein